MRPFESAELLMITSSLPDVLYLQISDDGVLHILLLFLQEVETHSVQCVRAQFIVPEENLRETHQSDSIQCAFLRMFSPKRNCLVIILLML